MAIVEVKSPPVSESVAEAPAAMEAEAAGEKVEIDEILIETKPTGRARGAERPLPGACSHKVGKE